jgi:hypothetical protein
MEGGEAGGRSARCEPKTGRRWNTAGETMSTQISVGCTNAATSQNRTQGEFMARGTTNTLAELGTNRGKTTCRHTTVFLSTPE